MSEGDTVVGHCIGCGRDNVAGQLVNEVHTNSGGGWDNVLCGPCVEAGKSAWRLRAPSDPNDYPTQSGSPQTRYGRS